MSSEATEAMPSENGKGSSASSLSVKVDDRASKEGAENAPAKNNAAKSDKSPIESKGGKPAKAGAKAKGSTKASTPAKSSGGTKTGSKPKLEKKESVKKTDEKGDKNGGKNKATREIKVPNREPPRNPPSKKEAALNELSLAQRKKVLDLEKKEKNMMQVMEKHKASLEGMTKKVQNIKWPVKDELVLDKLRLAEEQAKKGKPRHTHATDEQLQPPLPSPHIPILLSNQALACDVISCWDFMTVFGKEMELNLMSLDHFTELLQYTGRDSPAFIEVFSAPLRVVLADEALANRLSISAPLENNFARKETAAEAQIAELEKGFEAASKATQSLADSPRSGSSSPSKSKRSQINADIKAAHRDFRQLIELISRTSLLPRALTPDLLNEPLEWQEVLAGVFMYLPPVARLLRLNAELLNELTTLALAETRGPHTTAVPQGQDAVESVGMDIDGSGEEGGGDGAEEEEEGEEGLRRAGAARRKSVSRSPAEDSDDEDEEELGLNMDNAWALTGDIRANLTLCSDALRALTTSELYSASTEAKVYILKALFESCCDTEFMRELLASNHEAIWEKRSEMRKEAAAREAKKKEGSKDLKALAEKLCRAENQAKADAKEAAKRALEARKEEAARKKAEREKAAKEKEKESKDGKGKDKDKDKDKGKDKGKDGSPSKSAPSKEKETTKMEVEESEKDSKAKAKGAKGRADGSKDPVAPSAPQLASKVAELMLLREHDVDEIGGEPPVEEVSDSEDEAADGVKDDSGVAGIAAKKRKGRSRQETAEREERKKIRAEEMQQLEIAEDKLRDALESGLERELKRAARDAADAGMVWESDDGKRTYCTPLLYKVYKALKDIARAAEKVKADMEMEEVLQEYVVRSEPLGYDRYFNEYYCFRGDAHRLYVRIRSEEPSSSLITATSDSRGKQDRPPYFTDRFDADEGLRKLYETRPMKVSNPAVATWGIYGSAREIHYLVEALDDRGSREKALKMALRGKYPDAEAKPTEYKYDHEWVGRRVKRVFAGKGVKPAIGIVDGWLAEDEEEGDDALWHVKYKDGDEEELDLKEMNKFLIPGEDAIYFTAPQEADAEAQASSLKTSASSASLASTGSKAGTAPSKEVGDSLAKIEPAPAASKTKGKKGGAASSVATASTTTTTAGAAKYSKPVDVQLYMQRYMDPVEDEDAMDEEEGQGDSVGRSLSGRTIKSTKTYGQEIEQQQEAEARERAERSAKIKAQLEARFRDEEPEVCATYTNSDRSYKHRPASRENMGLSALKAKLHRCLTAVATSLKREGLQQVFTRDVKGALGTSISGASTAAELSSVVVELEGYVHQVQESRNADDVDDQEVARTEQLKNHEDMRRNMWNTDPAASPYIGKLVRCFFSRTGGSNGVVVGYWDKDKDLREKSKEKGIAKSASTSSSSKVEDKDEDEAPNGPSETAQYMVEHEDGEMEVMTEKILLKRISNFEEYAAKMETEAHLFSFFEDADIDQDEAQSYQDELHSQTSSHMWPIKHRIIASAATRSSAAAAARAMAAKKNAKKDGKSKSKSRKRARDEEETESEDGTDDEKETTDTLWPSKGVRDRWQSATRAAKSVAAVALSFSTFVANAVAYDALDEDEIYS